ncbi:hypothetical protein H8F24_02000 [Synechococcus sp. CBW1002]|uniref:VapE domain-containing protein n=1 Tax=Synechococcus sp. CBW1002 TaxID=1353134 RepID=UPI0018CCEECA|nr:VapE domain-containing protein [Synechococcus sp. CBW1002]QPN60275.1 hypothetical protein H8F24_02000 [Synechococcus sp. CBW1002]
MATNSEPNDEWWGLILELLEQTQKGASGRDRTLAARSGSALEREWSEQRWTAEEVAAAAGLSLTAEQLLSFVPKTTRELIEKGSPSGSRNEDGIAVTFNLRGAVNILSELGLDLQVQVEELLERFADNSERIGGDFDRERLQGQYDGLHDDVMPGRDVAAFRKSLGYETKGVLGDKPKGQKKKKKKAPGSGAAAGGTDPRTELTPGSPPPEPAEGEGGRAALLWDIGQEQWGTTADGDLVEPNGYNKVTFTRLVANKLGEELRYNDLTNLVEYKGGILSVDQVDGLDITLSKQDVFVSESVAIKVLLTEAKEHRYDPIADYLLDLQTQEVEAADIDLLASTYLGTSEPLYDRMLKVAVLGAVARRLDPGCQFDTVVVLKGEQGIRKSTFWKALASAPWYTSSVPEGEKDLVLTIHSKWIYELAELESVTGRRDTGRLKNLITTASDTLRVPYGKGNETRERRSIFVSTVNGDSFLNDNTGERRYLVIECPQLFDKGQLIDVEAVKRDRDAIWKGAVLAYQAGARPYLAQEDQCESNRRSQDYQQEDPWGPLLDKWIRGENAPGLLLSESPAGKPGKEGFTTTDALLGSGVRDTKTLHKPDEMAMAALLRARGYEKKRVQIGQTRKVLWQQVEAV